MSRAKVKTKTKTKVSKKTAAKPAKKAAEAPSTAAKAGWQSETLDRMRKLILEAEPAMVEERKWVKPTKPLGTPVFSCNGIVCTGEIYKDYVKLTFMYGASLPDPARLFNASLEGGTRRAIDIPQGAKLNERAFKVLVKAAVARNTTKKG
jgi:hypothetical protein